MHTKEQQDELFTEVGPLFGYNTLYRRRQDQVYYCPHKSTSLCAHQYKLRSLEKAKNSAMWSVLEESGRHNDHIDLRNIADAPAIAIRGLSQDQKATILDMLMTDGLDVTPKLILKEFKKRGVVVPPQTQIVNFLHNSKKKSNAATIGNLVSFCNARDETSVQDLDSPFVLKYDIDLEQHFVQLKPKETNGVVIRVLLTTRRLLSLVPYIRLA